MGAGGGGVKGVWKLFGMYKFTHYVQCSRHKSVACPFPCLVGLNVVIVIVPRIVLTAGYARLRLREYS